MAISSTFFDRHAAFAVAHFPQSATWKGGAYACIAEDAVNQEEHELAGFDDQVDLRLHFRTALFASARPAVGDAITYGGRSYRVESTTTAPDDITIAVGLKLKGQR